MDHPSWLVERFSFEISWVYNIKRSSIEYLVHDEAPQIPLDIERKSHWRSEMRRYFIVRSQMYRITRILEELSPLIQVDQEQDHRNYRRFRITGRWKDHDDGPPCSSTLEICLEEYAVPLLLNDLGIRT